ncbi:PPOX class F420-dependent oxidoreductase [Kibdelosporangium persicum]|uniref:Pyridoxamine 5'-phosphate oxidase n=1 Tax=Kibdelosporangium persicum TaxID=2698649 RepID=A0ABX2F8V1_9PSEU|nr:PPOX class F420-dependent oxidoreductase [Kibdelosporangium persicum]NRN67230.1 Pyridoxamine 5'-phosphate oxidase [Kibdelosporangium persicum]
MVFTDIEFDFLTGQRLGRLATAQPDGTLQINPVTFRYNSGTGTIDIGGRRMAGSQKFRNVTKNDRVAFVIDDLVSDESWEPRCLEIRGRGEALVDATDSAWAGVPNGFDGAIIRIHPRRVISFGIDPDAPPFTSNRRDVG